MLSQSHTHRLEITADNQPTVLERVLQVTRYRGFQVVDFNATINPENNLLEIRLSIVDPKETVALPEAGAHRLYHQLNKLFDVKHVNLAPSEKTRFQAQANRNN
jgi:acetolactate synthase II small subunit